MLKKIIYDITPFTTTDYKDHLSCIAWFITCNMRCPYCYNPDIVNCKCGNYSVDDLITFLKKRVGLLDGVVLSGGEATNHNLIPICEEIKKLKFKIKLDTNGSNPKQLEKLLKENLLDFVALDFKAPKEKFKTITKSNLYDKFIDSLQLLVESKIKYEVRTTLHNDLLNEDDINKMQTILIENNYKENYYIQNFLEVENISNLKASNNIFDIAKLDNKLNIVWRN